MGQSLDQKHPTLAHSVRTVPSPGISSGYLQVAKDVFSGTIGGIAVTLVGHPFDTVKVRLQTQPIDKPIYSGAIDCVKKTVQWEGVKGLYKGMSSPLAGQMLFRASLFGAFGQSKKWLGTNADGTTRALTTADFYKAGSMTGFVAAFTEGPIDFYKSQMQVQLQRARADPTYRPPFNSVLEAVRQSFRINGIKGPFQGLGATIIRNTPANGVYLGTFEVLKRKAAASYNVPVTEVPAWVILGSAGFGGLAYWVIIFPVDVVKSAMMTDSLDPAKRRFKTMASTIPQLWAEGGLTRFYKGFTPCIARAMPANAAMLFTVDHVSNLLNKRK